MVARRMARNLALVAMASLLLAAGCGGAKPSADPTPTTPGGANSGTPAKALTVKVGVIMPLSGSVSLDGNNFVNAAKLAVEEIKAAGGPVLDLQIEDGQCKPDISKNAAEKLVNDKKVAVLMGAFCSGATEPLIAVAEENKVPLISGVASAPKLTETRREWYFRSAPTESMLAAASVPYLSKDLGIKKVAFLAVNDDWGRGTVKANEDLLKANGLNVVTTEYFSHGETNFTSFLTKIKGLNPDAVFFVAETQDASMAIKQFDQQGLTQKKLGVGAMAGDNFLRLVGKPADGIIALVPYAYSYDQPQNNAFVTAFEKAYKTKPDKYAAAGYSTVYVVAEAIKKAGSADSAKIREALEKVEIETVQGTVKFNDKHQAFPRAMIARIENGAPKVIQTVITK